MMFPTSHKFSSSQSRNKCKLLDRCFSKFLMFLKKSSIPHKHQSEKENKYHFRFFMLSCLGVD